MFGKFRESEFAPTAGFRQHNPGKGSGSRPNIFAPPEKPLGPGSGPGRQAEWAPAAFVVPASEPGPSALEKPLGPGSCPGRHTQSGFTLIETIVALVIIGIAGAALLSVFITPVANSADPQIVAQARAVATSYLDEILLRDHGGGGCVGASRATWATIWCYDGLNEAPRDQLDNPIGALTDYTVNVAVDAISPTTARIVVHVTHNTGIADITLEGRRGNY